MRCRQTQGRYLSQGNYERIMDVWEKYLQARVKAIGHCLAWGLEGRLGDSVVLCLEGECNGVTDSGILKFRCGMSVIEYHNIHNIETW